MSATVPKTVDFSSYDYKTLKRVHKKLVKTARQNEENALWSAVHGWNQVQMHLDAADSYWARALLVKVEMNRQLKQCEEA